MSAAGCLQKAVQRGRESFAGRGRWASELGEIDLTPKAHSVSNSSRERRGSELGWTDLTPNTGSDGTQVGDVGIQSLAGLTIGALRLGYVGLISRDLLLTFLPRRPYLLHR